MQAQETFLVPVFGLFCVAIVPLGLGLLLLTFFLIDRAWFRGLLTALLLFGGLATGGLFLFFFLSMPMKGRLVHVGPPPRVAYPQASKPANFVAEPDHELAEIHERTEIHEHAQVHEPANIREYAENREPADRSGPGAYASTQWEAPAPAIASRPRTSHPTSVSPLAPIAPDHPSAGVPRLGRSLAPDLHPSVENVPEPPVETFPQPSPAVESVPPRPKWVAAPHLESKLAAEPADAEADLLAQVAAHLKEKFAADLPPDFAFPPELAGRAIADRWRETVPSPRLEQDMYRLHGRVSIDRSLADALAETVRSHVSRERSRPFLYWTLAGTAGLALLLPTSRFLRGRRPTWPPETVTL